MTIELPYEDGAGYIGRIAFARDVAEIRVYRYAVPADQRETPVLAIRFDGPQFTDADIRRFEGREMDATVFPDRVEFDDFYNDSQVTFRAHSVTAEWAALDIEDYRANLAHLDAAYADSCLQAVKADKSIEAARTLIAELLRRAEIKASASEEHRHRQAAAIEILQRLQRHFDEE